MRVPPSPELVDRVVAAVPAASAGDCVRVGIDGVDGAGKTTFANALAATLMGHGRTVVRVSADDFHHPRALRHRRGRDSPEGFWLDSFDTARLLSDVLVPLGPGGSRWYREAVHDLDSDAPIDLPARRAPAGSVLVVDGLFLHREQLVDHWELSVLLAVPFEVSVRRMADRDGSHPDPAHPSNRRYVRGQQLYFAACRPWERADLVVQNR